LSSIIVEEDVNRKFIESIKEENEVAKQEEVEYPGADASQLRIDNGDIVRKTQAKVAPEGPVVEAAPCVDNLEATHSVDVDVAVHPYQTQLCV
jgi:hypothetical protein